MEKLSTNKQSLIPVFVMVAFSVLLIGALLFKVYQADRDLGQLRSDKYQARLAAESAINFAVTKMCEAIRTSDRPVEPSVLTAIFFEDRIPIDEWISFGVKTKSYFRVTSIRKLSIDDDENTKLIDEGQQYQIIAEGRCGIHCYSTAAIVQLYDLANLFGVFQSLDEYYYGNPLFPYISAYGSFNEFYKANHELFDSGRITNQGKILDPKLLISMYEPNGKSPFVTPENNKITDNYGAFFSRNYVSPCNGPIYSSLPVVVDNHEFKAPAQTALYFYHRPGTNPVLKEKDSNSLRMMYSSPRIQHTSGNIEKRNLTKFFVDRDSIKYSSYIPSWRPDINHLRELSKSRGIYIDNEGKGYQNGNPINVDYHPGVVTMHSDSYLTPNSSKYEIDELKDEKYIVLASDVKYDGYNNIDGANLNGAKLIFSERSIYIRGEIGTDLIVVTPGHIFITGPTNIDSRLNLFLVAAQGTAISTVDLEDVIKKNNPTSDFIEAAREWNIRAVIYKPGAGVYSAASLSDSEKNTRVNFLGVVKGRSIKLHIIGSCIGGNLQRWIDNTERDSLVIDHDPSSAQRLMISPVSVNILKLRTRPVKLN
jgi:hypothetical protein